MQVFGIFFIPESPRWLVSPILESLNHISYENLLKCSIFVQLQAMVGRETELDAALQRLRGRTADISQESANIKVNFDSLNYLEFLLNVNFFILK